MSRIGFHTVHGSGVNLSQNGSVAQTVTTIDDDSGIVFSDRPIKTDEKVLIRIVASQFYGNIKLGFTQNDPRSFPKTFLQSSSNELTSTTGFWLQNYPHLDFKQDSVLSYSVNEFGDVTLEIDGEAKGLLFTMDICEPLWAVIDLRGQSTCIQIISPISGKSWLQEANDRLSWKYRPKSQKRQISMEHVVPSSGGQTRTNVNGHQPPFRLITNITSIQRSLAARFLGFRNDPRPRSQTPTTVNFIVNKHANQPSSPRAIKEGHANEFPPVEQEQENFGNFVLRISNIPSTTITDKDIKRKFESAQIVKIEISVNGTAKVSFKTEADASKAYQESELMKLGEPKLSWIKPEEIYVEDVPKNVTAAEIIKEFGKSRNVKFQNGENGRRIATVIFSGICDQRKAFENSHMTKLGCQRLAWAKESGGGKGAQLRITNVGVGISKQEISEHFSSAFQIKVEGSSGVVIVQYKTCQDAEKAYEDSNLLKLGNKSLGWLLPYELYIQDVPLNVKEIDLRKSFPQVKNVTWQNDKSGKRISTLEFANERIQRKAFNSSNYHKIGCQILAYGSDGGRTTPKNDNLDGLSEAELSEAQKVWALEEVGFSNFTHLFTPAIIVSGLPTNVTRLSLLRHFPEATKIEIVEMGSGKGPVAQIEFDSANKAAHAFGISRKLQIDGHSVILTPVRVGGSQRRNKIPV